MDTLSGESVAARFGRLVSDLAIQAGYDLRPGAGGRAALVNAIPAMSQSAVSRMLDGKTLPMPHQYEAIASALNVDVRNLLLSAGVISAHSWPEASNLDVPSVTTRSQPLSPEEAADAWGITDPSIRSMLINTIEQAISLQHRADQSERGDAGGL